MDARRHNSGKKRQQYRRTGILPGTSSTYMIAKATKTLATNGVINAFLTLESPRQIGLCQNLWNAQGWGDDTSTVGILQTASKSKLVSVKMEFTDNGRNGGKQVGEDQEGDMMMHVLLANPPVGGVRLSWRAPFASQILGWHRGIGKSIPSPPRPRGSPSVDPQSQT